MTKKSVTAKQKSSPSQPVRVGMGLDLSVTGMGLVVVQGLKLKRKRRYRTEPIPKGKVGVSAQSGLRPTGIFRGDDQERISYLAKKVVGSAKKFRPDLVLIEGYAFGARGRGLTILHELGGVVKHELFRMGQPFALVSPTALKMFATGNGKAGKLDMILYAKEMLEEQYGIPHQGYKTISDSDTADAFWLARMAEQDYDDLVDEQDEEEAS